MQPNDPATPSSSSTASTIGDVTVRSAGSGVATDPLVGVNVQDRIAPRQMVSGMARGRLQLGSPDLYADSSNQQIVSVSDGIPSVVMGNQPAFGKGFYVAAPGVDATINSDPDKWIFNSNQDIFKIVKSDTTSLPAVSLSTNSFEQSGIIIPHGLSYTPVVMAYGLVNQYFNFTAPPGFSLKTQRSYMQIPYDALVGSLPDISITKYSITVGVDGTNIYFGYCYVTSSSASGGTGYVFPAVPIRYYLLQESAT